MSLSDDPHSLSVVDNDSDYVPECETDSMSEGVLVYVFSLSIGFLKKYESIQ